eukprot:5440399-Pyramimonas_sp.AAC.3
MRKASDPAMWPTLRRELKYRDRFDGSPDRNDEALKSSVRARRREGGGQGNRWRRNGPEVENGGGRYGDRGRSVRHSTGPLHTTLSSKDGLSVRHRSLLSGSILIECRGRRESPGSMTHLPEYSFSRHCVPLSQPPGWLGGRCCQVLRA